MAAKRENTEHALSLLKQNESGKITVNPELFEEFERKKSDILFARQEAGVLHNSFEWGSMVLLRNPQFQKSCYGMNRVSRFQMPVSR